MTLHIFILEKMRNLALIFAILATDMAPYAADNYFDLLV